jgi:hypothetical protein
MAQPIEQKYWPTDYVDEEVPPGRESPTAWIFLSGGSAYLNPCEESDDKEIVFRLLNDGDTIEFTRCDTFLETTLMLVEDGFTLADPAPPEFEQCCVLDGWQSETLASSVDELAKFIREADGETGVEFRVVFYTYVDTGPWRFCAATNSFRPVKSEDAGHA